ncbi:sialidase family protein [Salegentibacter salegens]|uniref:exo-alpha-sialidase n=1 Tax=Salegentibacter salegens TaxID=143223 RepID=A0A1M7NNF8_9FLAO|nr:sialidase family protein [Salegentibacter salegens]PRX40015.1 sialidase-1 [Salegentibacter salegens]SHN05337.1 sialidase-1 [Salegentibacter salegens]
MKKIVLLIVLSAFLQSCKGNDKEKEPKIEEINDPETQELVFEDLFNAEAKENIACYRIPSLITAPNGDLIAAIDERVPSCADLRGSKDINIVQRRSTDNGKTWSDIETVVNFPEGESASDPSMIVDEETGEVFMFYNFMDLDNEANIYYLHVVSSKDNGKTWTEPRDITAEIAKEEWHEDFKFITSGRGTQTSTGRLLHTLVNLDSGLHLFGSDDHGKSWFLIDTPIQPADESKVIELADGRYMINSRVNTGEGHRYVHISDDKGESWKTRPETKLTDPGNNASIIRYSREKEDEKNRLLFSNSNSADERKNLSVRISYDEGETWSEGKTIYHGPAAYSDLTVLENGDIGVFFEADGYSRNLFTSFSLEWLTDK